MWLIITTEMAIDQIIHSQIVKRYVQIAMQIKRAGQPFNKFGIKS
jgi:hypothetical protein